MEDRIIFDNIMIAYEAVYVLKVYLLMSKELMVVKIDMFKAFDKVEWSYLRRFLEVLGFDRFWMDWIMACVLFVFYVVLMID